MSNPTTSDLIFSSQANHNFSRTLGELKRSALSISNRLDSITHDAAFADLVAKAFNRPLIANERCGSWYIDPKVKAGNAYFKSTDGHTGVWKFSLRRLNLHLLEVVGRCDGCIIVDSTRRGKSMPDALSKTIPIWCAVINRFLFPNEPQFHELYTPPQIVSPSEHAQMSSLLPSFLQALLLLKISADSYKSHISKPLRPVWVTPEAELAPTLTIFEDFYPVICCTVSRRVAGGEVSECGYIQGAGDDTENWAHGLTPGVFWANQKILLATPENELPETIERLVDQFNESIDRGIRTLEPCSRVHIASLSALDARVDEVQAMVVLLLPKVTEQSSWRISKTRMEVGLGSHKLASRTLRNALPAIIGFVEDTMSTGESIVLACDSGTDLSIGVALTIICLFSNDDGVLRKERRTSIDKNFIKSRLGWISISMPIANPSRATLQSVNSFLMKRG